ncbi:hypothetical protein KIN20_025982 [Parelaphostrongylus tenuis]|uniref:Uncharacterized protein n=1 Tax=Parelaphostrongylus tenuis TaxID=148309 RepID=A0AAD5MZ14_PARTN|nr:hypothetical protein KIN20_025982 [Parelaphostrongylus tenuis]
MWTVKEDTTKTDNNVPKISTTDSATPVHLELFTDCCIFNESKMFWKRFPPLRKSHLNYEQHREAAGVIGYEVIGATGTNCVASFTPCMTSENNCSLKHAIIDIINAI